jgi:hypothetical protein
VENTPGDGATAALKVDAGSIGINLHAIVNTTALSLAAGTTNILNDGANGITIAGGYFYTTGASEFNGTVLFDQNITVGANLAHTGSNLGFYSHAAAAKPTVTGAKGANAALASLLTALAGLGLLTDSSTA